MGTVHAGSPAPSAGLGRQLALPGAVSVSGVRVHTPLLGTTGTLGSHLGSVSYLRRATADLGFAGPASGAQELGYTTRGVGTPGRGRRQGGEPCWPHTHHADGVDGVPLGHGPHTQGQHGEVSPGVGPREHNAAPAGRAGSGQLPPSCSALGLLLRDLSWELLLSSSTLCLGRCST